MTKGHAHFFALDTPQKLADLLAGIHGGSIPIDRLAEEGRVWAHELGRKERYQRELTAAYAETLGVAIGG